MNILFNIKANWLCPINIHGFTTTRLGGSSKSPFDQNNLAFHVGDNDQTVQDNRQQLLKKFGLPKDPIWLNQTHSITCINVDKENNRNGDSAVTRKPNCVLSIMTADCLPIIICNNAGDEVAAIHAGWRGLANGIIEQTLSNLTSNPSTLLAWIGPSICQKCFEVQDEVRHLFLKNYNYVHTCFEPLQNMRLLADLPKIADLILKKSGVPTVYHADMCTYEQKKYFYSYRRDTQTGRIATFIWFT